MEHIGNWQLTFVTHKYYDVQTHGNWKILEKQLEHSSQYYVSDHLFFEITPP